MILTTFVLSGFVASTSAIGPFFLKTPPKIPQGRPQVQPKVNNRPNNDKPDLPPKQPAPAQEQIEANNVGGLNDRLKNAEDIANLIGIGKDLAEAILATAPSTTIKVSPTVTVNATAFAPCKSYASVLASCVSATTSFYDLEYDKQASCACYRESTNTAACQATPTLDTSYDDYEYGCYDFFISNGYRKVAQAMNDSIELPGPKLCSWAPAEFSMPSIMAAKTVSCAAVTSTSPAPASTPNGDSGSRTAPLLTAFDQDVFMVFAVTVAALSWMLLE